MDEFFRLDNYSTTCYFYLDKPTNNLPPLTSLNERIEGLTGKLMVKTWYLSKQIITFFMKPYQTE